MNDIKMLLGKFSEDATENYLLMNSISFVD